MPHWFRLVSNNELNGQISYVVYIHNEQIISFQSHHGHDYVIYISLVRKFKRRKKTFTHAYSINA